MAPSTFAGFCAMQQTDAIAMQADSNIFFIGLDQLIVKQAYRDATLYFVYKFGLVKPKPFMPVFTSGQLINKFHKRPVL
jgi:hypothetical protein